MADAPSLSWLASVDDATLRGDVDRAARVLVDARRDQYVLDGEIWSTAVRRVISSCIEAGPGALSASDAVRLLYPLMLTIDDRKELDTFKTELSSLGRRHDILRSSALSKWRDILNPDELNQPHDGSSTSPEEGVADTTVHDTEVDSLVERLPFELPPLSDAVGLVAQLQRTALRWVDRRMEYESVSRASADVWLLRAMALYGVAPPVRYAESLYLDSEIWSTPAAMSFAEGLTQPYMGRDGLAAAALLNSRLRRLRPRVFLRFPEALILEEIGARADTTALVREVIDSVAEPFLRSVEAIDVEISRPKDRRPRKEAFRPIRDLLAQVLSSLGYRIVGSVGDAVAFDPASHVSFTPLEAGEPATVTRPGLATAESFAVKVQVQAGSPDSHPEDERE